ncbi:MAG: selenocysteine-specific translation elongation factor [Acidobacteriota bacterium]
MKRIIVGTAGHIDHGKTSLIKALTGVDADRLKEEKERGITIDLGFADLTIGDIHFGFVDVPGHERFVRNMLAGAHGIDMVMLVVAADESLMPQTREHFEICRLLEIKSGLVVINKADLVDQDFLELVEAEVAEYVAGSFLEGAPVLRVSSRTGQGIDELKQTLARLAARLAPRDETAVARLPIDRVLTSKGCGSGVTGSLIAGSISVGDELELLPAAGRRARVRNLQVHGRSTPQARAGERTAVNLQGLDLTEISRGQVLAPAGRLLASSLLDVRLQLLASAGRPLRSRSRVHLHLGTAETLARVVLLGESELQPGQECFAQLRLESPLAGLPGDRYIIRGHSPIVTIGGGRIIDAHPLKHRHRDFLAAREAVARLAAADPVERIALFVEMAGRLGLSQADLAARSGAPDETIDRVAESLIRSRRLVAATTQPWLLISRVAFDDLAREVRTLLKNFHQRSPLEAGMGREEVRERIFSDVPPGIFRAVVNQLVERQELVAEKDLLRLASHRIALSAEEQAARDRLAELFAEAGLQPLSLDEAVARAGSQAGIDLARAQRFAQMLINSGELVRVAELVFHRRALEGLRETLRRQKDAHGPKLDVAVFKELTGVSRKYAIPLLEYLDRQRITRRNGEVREIV